MKERLIFEYTALNRKRLDRRYGTLQGFNTYKL